LAIQFETVRYKNFLSTGNVFTEIQLNRTTTTLITGENGAGKSTLADAICFVLFGLPYRGINKPQLVNSINKKHLLVEIEFNVNGIDYRVRRGIKPTVFEVFRDDTLLNQNAKAADYQEHLERHILNLNYRTFKQIVILGSSSFIPFMSLKSGPRREIIESLLDLQIFTSMNRLLSDKFKAVKRKISDADHSLMLATEKLQIHEGHMATINQSVAEQLDQLNSKLDATHASIASKSATRDKLHLKIDGMSKQLYAFANTVPKMDRARGLRDQIVSKKDRALKRIEFFYDNDECPTCAQSIDIAFKKIQVDTKNQFVMDAEDAIRKIKQTMDDLLQDVESQNDINSQITSTNERIIELNTEIQTLSRAGEQIVADIDSVKEDKTNLKENRRVQKNLRQQKKNAEQKLAENKKQQIELNVCGALLKDKGIKADIIKQYVPIMNQVVNQNLAAMDFFVNFELDENFNEVIKSRHRDEFSYTSFSEGEKQRIDLALLFTWRAIAKMKNSMSTNLLILDETFDSSLDTTGCEDFLKLIYNLGGQTNTFVISHKGDMLQDKFHSNIRFEKIKGFSKVTDA